MTGDGCICHCEERSDEAISVKTATLSWNFYRCLMLDTILRMSYGAV
jgi:hypothetical protein